MKRIIYTILSVVVFGAASIAQQSVGIIDPHDKNIWVNSINIQNQLYGTTNTIDNVGAGVLRFSSNLWIKKLGISGTSIALDDGGLDSLLLYTDGVGGCNLMSGTVGDLYLGTAITNASVRIHNYVSGTPAGLTEINYGLQVNKDITAKKYVAVTDTIPASFSTDQDNYDIGSAGAIELSSTAVSPSIISGFKNGVDGRILYITNVGTQSIIFANQNAGSTAANRFITAVTLTQYQTATYIYHSSLSRWVRQQ